ncbi:MAG: N-acetylmuramoyl-L-alanine amidase family protein [Chloroflexota bacterium]
MYPPTGPAVHRTVFVDAGHGGVDPGAIGVTSAGASVEEKTVTLAVAQQLLPHLRAAGYNVLMSRTADVPVTQPRAGDTNSNGFTLSGEHKDTAARIQCANAGHTDLLLAIHFNSFYDPSAGGAETIYDASRPFAAQNERFAELVQRQLIASFSAAGWTVPDRGAKDDSQLNTPAFTTQAENYGHLLELGPAQAGWLEHPSAMPGALTEPLFVTDRAEADVAADPRGQQAMASALAAAVAAYFAPPTASASGVPIGSSLAPLGATAAP